MRFNSRFSALLVSFSAFGLVSCGYAVEKSNQDIKFVTIGAQNAQCDVMIDKLKYTVSPPQTINVMKHDGDMEVTCLAPGNRAKSVVVPANVHTRAIWGTPAGVAWDYASQSLYHYPSLISIDFTDLEASPNPLPSYHNEDVADPDSHDLEEFLPAQPRLNSDRKAAPVVLKRKDDVAAQEAAVEETPVDMPKVAPQDKGNLTSILDKLKKAGEQDKGKASAPPAAMTPAKKKAESAASVTPKATLNPDIVKAAQKNVAVQKVKVETVKITPMPKASDLGSDSSSMPALEDNVSKIAPQAGNAPVKLTPEK